MQRTKFGEDNIKNKKYNVKKKLPYECLFLTTHWIFFASL